MYFRHLWYYNQDMDKLVIASANEGKIRELREMLEPEGYEILSLKDLKDPFDVEETGTTFAENALIKARYITEKYGLTAIADDSGLEIDAFGGEPGIYSARYLGHDTPYEYKNKIILERMQGMDHRACRYVCAIAYTSPDGTEQVFEDTCECEIALEPAGNRGFGYDPIMYYPPYRKTIAEMDDEEKNQISHRGKALRKLEKWLNEQD